MTQEEKQLLLIDLCARLPYGVICNLYDVEDANKKFQLKELSNLIISAVNSECIKPYLRPMSSMTEEEKNAINSIILKFGDRWLDAENPEGHWVATFWEASEITDYLNSIHIDFRGLIPMVLALEAKEGMYEIK